MRTAALLTALLLVPAPAACGGAAATDTGIVVLGPWLDTAAENEESDVFDAVLQEYGEEHGLNVRYQGTRAIGAALRAKVRDGTLPDIAILPNVGELAQYATEGLARPVTGLVADAPAPSAGVTVDHRALWRGAEAYAVGVKTDLKSLVLFNPDAGQLPAAVPDSYAALLALGTAIGPHAWCLGMSAASAGWPGTDWIEDLVLHSAGAEVYEQWASGAKAWTDQEIKSAWEAWAPIVRDRGREALLTSPSDAAEKLRNGRCRLLHQPSFFGPASGDFLPFPPRGGTVEVSGDFAARFTDNPAAEGLLAHIVQGDAWVQRSQGRIYPVRVRPGHGAYGPLARRVAGELSGAALRCLDASDAMPATMAAAFHTAVLEFIADPDQLKDILPRLEEVRIAIPEYELLEVRCTG